MRLSSLALALGLSLAAVAATTVAPALAQRGGAAGNWELLAEEKVGFGADREVITLRNDENFYRSKSYRRLRFVASGGEVRMRSIRLVYLNGHAEDLDFNQNLQPGQQIDVDLRGERSYLRQIEMFYKAKFGISLGQGGIRVNQPTIKVFGDNVRGGPPGRDPGPGARPRPGPIAGWNELDVQSFDRREDRLVMPVGRREGAVAQIILRSDLDTVEIEKIQIVYGNGQTQNVRINQRLGYGEATRPIDLDGDRRFIQRVIVNFDARRRPGPAMLALFGKDEPPRRVGGGGVRPDWVPLGETRVGFRTEREVIRVGQSEDWFRNRGFDKLHFLAENNDVQLMSIRIVYLNGFREDYQVNRNLDADGDGVVLDLRGRRSYIREIEFVSRKRPGNRGPAIVKVFGEEPRGFRR